MSGASDGNGLRGRLIVLVGGSGFVGAHVAQELLARGARVRIVSRHPERAFRLGPLGNLGQLQLLRGDMARPESIVPALQGADGVVNLVGVFGGNIDALHVKGPAAIAAAAKVAGVKAFVQISAIGADASSPVPYARTKAEGEAAVRAGFPGASVLRPSIVFGPDDMFINRFAGLIAMLPALPVFGPEAKLQPVFVDDVALAVAAALDGPVKLGGKVFELGGPEVLTMLELNQRIAKAQGRTRLFAALPDAASSVFATATGWLPGAPITRDQWALLKAGNVADARLPGFKTLGIVPRPLALFLDRWMVRYRKHGRFGAKAAAS
ncbi:MAG TPA: complex I NDUFA9 subunit family protein [Novosphingobium sp.]|nr:complex I NDUFA9 subunit family protein [Novosphingobium sp.]